MLVMGWLNQGAPVRGYFVRARVHSKAAPRPATSTVQKHIITRKMLAWAWCMRSLWLLWPRVEDSP